MQKIHIYHLSGMTCGSCEAKVKKALLSLTEVSDVVVSKADKVAIVTVNQPITLQQLQAVLDDKYQITASDLVQNKADNTIPSTTQDKEQNQDTRSWLETYRPIVLIFSYILAVSLLIQLKNSTIDLMEVMRHFMAGFFLVFSFFKFLNLQGFAQSYRMYDVVAKKLPIWAYLYAFVELFLGIAYLLNINPILTNTITLVVMSVSIIGVLQSVLNKQKIQCACLGAVFDLPMSTLTIIEDALMILMSLVMLLQLMLA